MAGKKHGIAHHTTRNTRSHMYKHKTCMYMHTYIHQGESEWDHS